jgi:hypothetical protein
VCGACFSKKHTFNLSVSFARPVSASIDAQSQVGEASSDSTMSLFRCPSLESTHGIRFLREELLFVEILRARTRMQAKIWHLDRKLGGNAKEFAEEPGEPAAHRNPPLDHSVQRLMQLCEGKEEKHRLRW